jgi:hypothetical protein
MPAFLWESLCRKEFTETTAWIVGGSSTSKLSPPIEATNYDNLPPARSKYVATYQNRLFLGDDDFWFWSDPFKMDTFNNKVFNYIALTKSTGGRHTGGIEFGDHMVLFTETQTWGLTNVDMDIPQLFPIALGIGCVAPDSIAAGDGLLVWLASDGFYAWDGSNNPPKKISSKMDGAFSKMSFDAHGGSKATIHNRRYDIRLSNPDYSVIGNAYRFTFETGEWSKISHVGFSSSLFPLATIFAPLGNNDAGYIHPLWGKVDYGTGAGEYGLFLGELTTQDAGSNYTCYGDMHFPVPPGELFTPYRIKAYYQAADGWGTPAFSFLNSDVIGSSVGTISTGTADTGDDYSVIGGTFSQVGRGSSCLKVRFSVSSAAGGTVNRQRLFGALLQGKASDIRRGGV